MIASADQDAAREVYAAEALVRYVAGMFYALGLSSGLMTALIIVDVLATGAIALWLILILAGYLSALCAIAWYYRAIRCKEVFTVFAASFRNYSAFLDRDRQHVLMSLAEEARQASVEGDQAGSGDG